VTQRNVKFTTETNLNRPRPSTTTATSVYQQNYFPDTQPAPTTSSSDYFTTLGASNYLTQPNSTNLFSLPDDRPASYGFQQPNMWITNLRVSNLNQPAPHSVQPRAPQMSIQTFSGDPQDWPSFIAGFKILIHDACASDAESLYHLRNSLRQDVRDRISYALLHPGLYQHTLKELHRKYGNVQLVAQACNVKLMALSAFKEDDYKALQKFSAKVRWVVCTLKYGGYDSQLGCFAIIFNLLLNFPSASARVGERRAGVSSRDSQRLSTLTIG
jgi:hypothetical protein